MRGVEERLAAYKANPSTVPGRCAERVMLALDVPRQGKDNATQMAQAVPKGKMMQGRAPRGAIPYWDRGTDGNGHVCFALGDGTELSVDVIAGKPGRAGVVPFAWFGKNWPALRYLGWSWYWGSLNTEPKEDPVAKWPAVGSKKVIEIPKLALTPGKYAVATRITLPPGEYLLTLQGRLPAGAYARVEFVRVGWGSDPDGRDQTGSTPWTPPDPLATSFSHTHPISGGGPVEYMVKIVGGASATSVVCKAVRFA